MYDHDDNLKIKTSVLNIDLHPEDRYREADRSAQDTVYCQVVEQVRALLKEAVEERHNIFDACRVLINALKLVREFTATYFDRLLPLQREIEGLLHQSTRMATRIVIRRALVAPPEQYEQIYKPHFKTWGMDNEMEADYEAATDNLKKHIDLFKGLRRRDHNGRFVA